MLLGCHGRYRCSQVYSLSCSFSGGRDWCRRCCHPVDACQKCKHRQLRRWAGGCGSWADRSWCACCSLADGDLVLPMRFMARSLSGRLLCQTVGGGLLLAASAAANLHLHKSMQAGTPPNAGFMKKMLMLSRGALVLVLGGTAITTTM